MTDYPPCRKCGATHKMGIKNMETGEIQPIDLCRDCIFYGTCIPITKQICLVDLPYMIDPNILQNQLSETMKSLTGRCT